MLTRTTKPASEAKAGEVLILPNGSGRVIERVVLVTGMVMLLLTGERKAYFSGLSDLVTVEVQ